MRWVGLYMEVRWDGWRWCEDEGVGLVRLCEGEGVGVWGELRLESQPGTSSHADDRRRAHVSVMVGYSLW